MSEKHQFVYRNTGPLTLTADCESCARLRAELAAAKSEASRFESLHKRSDEAYRDAVNIAAELANCLNEFYSSSRGHIVCCACDMCVRARKAFTEYRRIQSISTPPADAAKGECNDAE